jgi:hypothetical protein
MRSAQADRSQTDAYRDDGNPQAGRPNVCHQQGSADEHQRNG